jgi:hypothetical protein
METQYLSALRKVFNEIWDKAVRVEKKASGLSRTPSPPSEEPIDDEVNLLVTLGLKVALVLARRSDLLSVSPSTYLSPTVQHASFVCPCLTYRGRSAMHA